MFPFYTAKIHHDDTLYPQKSLIYDLKTLKNLINAILQKCTSCPNKKN